MDYKQELITTIHDLSYQPDRLEQRLTELSQTHPTAVLIPSLYEELGRPALGVIRDHLSHCPFVNNVISLPLRRHLRAVSPCGAVL